MSVGPGDDALADRPRNRAGQFIRGEDAAGDIEDAEAEQLGGDVDQRGAAQSGGAGVADDVAGEVAVGGDDLLDGAVGGPHAVGDAGALEGGAGGCRGRHEPAVEGEDDLAVGSDVDEDERLVGVVHGCREDAGHGVAADETADVREDVERRVGVDPEADVAGIHEQPAFVRRGEGDFAEGIRADAAEQVLHGGVPGHDHFVDALARHTALFEELVDQPVEGVEDGLLHVFEGAGLLAGPQDAADDVVAGGDLRVEDGGQGPVVAAEQVNQDADQGGGSEVKGDTVALARCVPRLDANEAVVTDGGGDAEGTGAQHGGQPAQDVEVGAEPQAEGGFDPAEVGLVVAPARFGQLEVAFPDGRFDFHGPSAGGGQDLAAGLLEERLIGDFDHAVARHAGLAGQAHAFVQLGGGEQLPAGRGRLAGAAADADAALAAGAFAAARTLQHQPRPRRALIDRGAGQHENRAAARFERDFELLGTRHGWWMPLLWSSSGTAAPNRRSGSP
ncbi:MAG: hypothetical protein BWZ02_02816 [Lentisphaerae bacterium ADurb.BinA184]|nr:MAG: hypothetical protein BWZ02_02816 [Lentisphaerae bacterium ADurb.BinA184]